MRTFPSGAGLLAALLSVAFLIACDDTRAEGNNAPPSEPGSAPPTLATSAGPAAGGVALAARHVSVAQPTKLTAVHKDGQTFLSWDELEGATKYQVYRHNKPITAATLDQATLLGEVGNGSARAYASRYRRGGWKWRYDERLPGPDGKPVPAGRGLLVWTMSEADAMPAHYAVISATRSGANRKELAPGNSIGPVEESIADPRPIEVSGANVGPGGHLMVQYMDLRNFNPTFHAPRKANEFYGLPADDPGRSDALVYAFEYTVYEPSPTKCKGPGKFPVVLKLHGWGDNRYAPLKTNPDPWWCVFMVFPTDQNQTWHFGFAEKTDFRTNKAPSAGDSVVNYTEARTIRMVHDLLRDPQLGPRADTNKVFVFGHSMGGSGALAMATRYPDLFAAAYAASPMANYRTSGSAGGANWVRDVAPKWGSPDHNLPVKLQFPGGYGAHLKKYEGTGVWDWQNHIEQLKARVADPMVPFGVLHGTADTQVEWSTQGAKLFPALNVSKRPWSAIATAGGHNWQGFKGLGGPLQERKGAPFQGFRMVHQETVPGLSNLSTIGPLEPPGPGRYNHTIHWSSSWNSWDGAPIEAEKLWRISLCTTNGEPGQGCGTGEAARVDVTPRRLQKFIVTPGATYSWKLKAVNGKKQLAAGQVTVGADGLITVPGVEVLSAGVRLEITPAPAP